LLRLIALMMETASTSETSLSFYQTAKHNTPEDTHLDTRRRENLKSHVMLVSSPFLWLLEIPSVFSES
jgi:hypothetical protein